MNDTFTDLTGISVRGRIRSSTQGLMTGTVSEMPDASTSKDIAVLYVGPDGDYIHGSYYLSDGESWQKLNIDTGLEVDPAPIQDSTNPVASRGVYEELANKVDKEEGKGLSSNDFTGVEKVKLAGVAHGAQANVIEEVFVNGNPLTPLDKMINIDLSDYTTKDQAVSSLSSSGSTITYRKADGTLGSVAMPVDPALSTSSVNPIQNRVVANALATKLDSTGTAVKAVSDANGNNIANTYATKAALNDKQDKLVAGSNIIINGNTISATGGGSGESVSITIDSALSSTSENPVQNKVIGAWFENEGIIGISEVDPNVLTYTKTAPFNGTYAHKPLGVTLVSSVNTSVENNTLKVAVNGVESSVTLPTSPGGSVTIDSAMSPSSTNPVQNKVINTALGKKADLDNPYQDISIGNVTGFGINLRTGNVDGSTVNEETGGITAIHTQTGVLDTNYPIAVSHTYYDDFAGDRVSETIGYCALVDKKGNPLNIVNTVSTKVEDNNLTIGINDVESTVALPSQSDWTISSTAPSYSTLFSYSSSTFLITALKDITFVVNSGKNHSTIFIPKGTTVYRASGSEARFTGCILKDGTASGTYSVQAMVVRVDQDSYSVGIGNEGVFLTTLDYKTSSMNGTDYYIMYR